MLGRPSRWSTLPRTKPEQRLTIPFDLPKTYKKEFPIQNHFGGGIPMPE